MNGYRRCLIIAVALGTVGPAAACTDHSNGRAAVVVQPCLGPRYAGVHLTPRTLPAIEVTLVRDGKTVRTITLRYPWLHTFSVPAGTYKITGTGPFSSSVHPRSTTAEVPANRTTKITLGQPCL
jgi:hypothetical protein